MLQIQLYLDREGTLKDTNPHVHVRTVRTIPDFWKDKEELVAQGKIPFQHTGYLDIYLKMLAGI